MFRNAWEQLVLGVALVSVRLPPEAEGASPIRPETVSTWACK